MKIREVQVDYATIQHWVYKFSLIIKVQMKKRKLGVRTSWRMDETHIKVNVDSVNCIEQLIPNLPNEAKG